MEKNKIITLLLYFFPFALFSQIGPGGVNSNLHLWLKANAGVNVTGINVSQWTNQSSQGMTAQASKTATSNVTLSAAPAGFNYNPSIAFDGTSGQRLTGVFSSASTTAALMFVVSNKTNASSACCLNPYSLSPAGAMGIGFSDGASNLSSYGIDGSGFVCSPTPNAVNRTVLVRADYASGTNGLNAFTALNGLPNTTCGSGTLSTPNGTFEVGGRTYGSLPARIFYGSIAEVVHYNSNSITAAQVVNIESYLALKYGITLNNSLGGTNGDYRSSSLGNILIWDASDGPSYHHNVIGIGRDDSSSLQQKQSHQVDDSVRLYIGSSPATTNAGNTATFAANNAFIVIGSNTGQMKSNAASITEIPGGYGIFSRLDREWKLTNTDFSDSFSIDIVVSTSPIYQSQLRLLVDSDGDFSNASVYTPTITVSGNTITVAGLSSTYFPLNSTSYFTIASLSSQTPLPVKIIDFNVAENGSVVDLSWQSLMEKDCHYYLVSRSKDGENWNRYAEIPCNGNSDVLKQYSVVDTRPGGMIYYSLTAVDLNGAAELIAVKKIRSLFAGQKINVTYQADGIIHIEGAFRHTEKLTILNSLGQDVSNDFDQKKISDSAIVLYAARMPKGVYLIVTGETRAKLSNF